MQLAPERRRSRAPGPERYKLEHAWNLTFAKAILWTLEASNLKLNYTIKFVADMDRAMKFYCDVLGLPLRFQSPGWSEFSTGETSLHCRRAKAERGDAVLYSKDLCG